MGYQINKFIILLLVIIVLPGCWEDADITGMFISDETVNQRFEQSEVWNNQNPERLILVPSDDYLMLVMSDSHVGGTQNLGTFLDSAINKGAIATVMAGDLTTGHGKDYSVFQRCLPDQAFLPSFQVAGNHDLYFGGWKHFYSAFGSSTYVFIVQTTTGRDLFICLDTGSGTLGNKQLKWFREKLQNRRPDYRRCIVFTHNNLFRFRRTTSTNPLIEELHVLTDLFIRHDVDMVITGHDHKKYVQLFGKTTHVIMDALKDGAKNAGYFQFQISNGVIDYSFINL